MLKICVLFHYLFFLRIFYYFLIFKFCEKMDIIGAAPFDIVVTFLFSLCLSSSVLSSVFPIIYITNLSFLIHILLPYFPFLHSTGYNPQSWWHISDIGERHFAKEDILRKDIPAPISFFFFF